MPNIEDKLKLAARITQLRSELAAAEAQFAGTPTKKPARPSLRVNRRGRGVAVSVSQRVLTMVANAGREGIARRDILAVIPNEAAVHSALKAHQTAGRIYHDGGQWCVTDLYVRESQGAGVPEVSSTQRETKPMRVVQQESFLGEQP